MKYEKQIKRIVNIQVSERLEEHRMAVWSADVERRYESLLSLVKWASFLWSEESKFEHILRKVEELESDKEHLYLKIVSEDIVTILEDLEHETAL